MTSNAPDSGYRYLLDNYKNTLSRFIGPTETFVYGDTLQLKDYSKTDWNWSMFNSNHKYSRHKEIYPQKLKDIFEFSSKIFR